MDEAVLHALPDAVLVTAMDGCIMFINRAAEAMFGYDAADLVGQPLEILIPDRFRRSHLVHRVEYAASPRMRPMGHGLTLQALTKDGHEIPVEISLAPVQIGSDTFTIAAVRDVTERRQLEERARQAAKAEEEVRRRDEVLAVASHELRGPVGIVQLQAAALQRAAAETAQDFNAMREKMQRIERNARHLARLVEDLLDVQQLRQNKLPLEFEDVDLRQIAHEVVERVREQVAQTGASLALDATAPVVGRWDPVRMDQVFMNLIMNAAKFGQGKPILVTVEGDGERAKIEVADEGVGIDPVDHERIFERFEQATASGRRGGLGLGLYIVRQIAHAHGGRVLVRSSPGKGSTFTVELPRAQVRSA